MSSHQDDKGPVLDPVADGIRSINNPSRQQVILLIVDAAEVPIADKLGERIAATEGDCPTDQLTTETRLHLAY